MNSPVKSPDHHIGVNYLKYKCHYQGYIIYMEEICMKRSLNNVVLKLFNKIHKFLFLKPFYLIYKFLLNDE